MTLHLVPEPPPEPEPKCSCLFWHYHPRLPSGAHAFQQVLPSCEVHGNGLPIETAVWLAEEEDAARAASVAISGSEGRARNILRDRLELLREARDPSTPRGRRI